MTTCLTPAEIEGLRGGTLSPKDKKRAEAHIAACETCRSQVESQQAESQLFGDIKQAYEPESSGPLALDTITLQPSLPNTRALTVPRQLGPILLDREIGSGGMGVVYLGRDQVLDRDVAVKFLLNIVARADDENTKIFLDGARAAASADGTGLVTVYHADLIEDLPYIVMQFIDGPSLREMMEELVLLDTPATLSILESVASATALLHDRKIVHRDIKPGNVLLDADGSVFVCDFGLAVARRCPGRGMPVESLAGTPAYMAPEMFRGVISPRTDVYALGIMAFELLGGRVPFEGTLAELREKHIQEPLPTEGLLSRGIPRVLTEVLQRATHKSDVFRYKTARHFLHALQDAIAIAACRRAGVAELSMLVARCRTSTIEPKRSGAGPFSSGSYHETLHKIATARQEERPTPEGEVKITPPLAKEAADERAGLIELPLSRRGLVGDYYCWPGIFGKFPRSYYVLPLAVPVTNSILLSFYIKSLVDSGFDLPASLFFALIALTFIGPFFFASWTYRVRVRVKARFLMKREMVPAETSWIKAVVLDLARWPSGWLGLPCIAQTLVSLKHTGMTIRACSSEAASAVYPLTAAFEPCLLSDASKRFEQFQPSSDVGASADGLPWQKLGLPGLHRLGLLLLPELVWTITIMFFFVLKWMTSGVYLRDWLILAGVITVVCIALAMIRFLVHPTRSMEQWFLVPGGLLSRRLRHFWTSVDVHHFVRDQSVLCVYQIRRYEWEFVVADDQESRTVKATKRQMDCLLSAWLSPVTLPPLGDSSDLA